MTDELQAQQRIFETAMEIADGAERESFVRQACDGDDRLRTRVERLLKNALRAEEFFQPPKITDQVGGTVATALGAPPAHESWIGPYRLKEQIGAGSEGVVYVAEQLEPVQRTVAIKIVKTGLHTTAAIGRFLAERQTLALMEHPNIARIFDAGATENGTPYFVMELVRGNRITEFADEHKLTLNERLKIFLQVCNAVQHAHQKGAIHRDLKPSNIIVTTADGVPTPKIIDFGIAKIAAASPTGSVTSPHNGLIAGTPAYMSPEQVAGDADLDTRSDVYCLGVLLYELLVGQPPINKSEVLKGGYDALRSATCDNPPANPQKRFQGFSDTSRREVAAKRSLSVAELVSSLSGELESILLKCLARSRDERYQTARDLAEDLRRYLRNEPVIACEPTPIYRLKKFTVRNKLAVASAFLILICLAGGIAGTTAALLRERKAKIKAESAEKRERTERLRAEAGEIRAKRFAYASDMVSAQQAFDLYNRGRARELLARNIPNAGEMDLRGWEWWLLWESSRSDSIRTHPIQEASIFACGYLDDQLIATRDGAFVIKIRDAFDGRETESITSQGYGRSLAITPKQAIMAYADHQSRAVKLVNYNAREEDTELAVKSGPWCLAFSPDGRYLAGICRDEKARVWDRLEKREVAAFPARSNDGWHKGAVAFSPAGDLLAFGHTDGTVAMIATQGFTLQTNFVAANGGITTLAFSPDGSLLATASGFVDSAIKVWDAKTAGAVRLLRGHDSWISSLAFSPAGETLVSGSGDQTIRIWRTSDGRQISVLRGHSDEVYALAFSPDGKHIVSGSKAGELMTWDAMTVRNGEQFTEFPEAVSRFVFRKDDSAAVLLTRGRSLTFAKVPNFAEREEIGEIPGGAEIAIIDDASIAAVAEGNGRMRIWNLIEKHLITDLSFSAGVPVFLAFTAVEPKRLVIMDSRRCVTIWDAASWQKIATWQGNEKTTSAALSSGASHFALGCNDGTLETRDLLSGRILSVTNAHRRVITGIDFKKDNSLLVTSSEDALVKVWRTSNLTLEATLRGHVLGVHSVCFSPDGARIASTSQDKQAVKVWDALTYRELITLKGKGTFFQRSAFSPDGKTLASLNAEGILHMWSTVGK